MGRWQIGAFLVIAVTVVVLGAKAVHAQIALPTIHVNQAGQLPKGECQPDQTRGYPPDSSIRYPMSYVEKGKKKQSLLGMKCKGAVPPKGVAVHSECYPDYADTGKCMCVEWKDQKGVWQKCDSSKLPKSVSPSNGGGTTQEGGAGQTPKKDGAGSATPATGKTADATKTPSSGGGQGSEGGATPAGGGGAPSGGGSGGGQQGGQQGGQSQPSQTASQLDQALNPTPISQQQTMKEPVKVDQLPKELYDPKPGTIADNPFSTPSASAPQGTTPRPVQTVPFQGGGTVAGLQPPTGGFTGATTDRPPVYDSFNYDSTFSGGPQPTQQAPRQQAVANPCDSVFSYSCISSVSGRAADAVGNVANQLLGVTSASAAPYDRGALQSIDKTTKAFCDVYGCASDSSQLAKAIAGVCAQEAGGCNPSVPHPGSQYQGLPQTNPLGAKENEKTFDFFANNPYVAMSDESRAQFQYLSQRHDQLVAQGLDPRKDPEVGAAMLVAQQFSLDRQRAGGVDEGVGGGFSPALVAADYARQPDGTVDPVKAAAVMQTAQICPDCVRDYQNNPDATLTSQHVGWLNSKANRVSVKTGDPVSSSFDAMLQSPKAYAPTFTRGINAHTLATANPYPAFLEPQVAYTMGNVGKTQYPQALAYTGLESSGTRGFPGSGTSAAGSFTEPSAAYRMPSADALSQSTFSRPITSTSFAPQAGQGGGSGLGGSARTPSFFTQSFFSQPVQRPAVSMGYSNPSTGYQMPGGSAGQFTPTLAPTQSSYAPYTGGPLPLFTQGSVPSQLTGIGGSPSAPAFTGQSFYSQPTAPAYAPYSGGSLPVFAQGSAPSQITSIGGSPSAPAFTQQSYYGQPAAAAPKPAYSFTDPVAYPYTMPSLAPVSVTPQSFAGASQINPLAGGGASGQFLPSLQSSQPTYAPYAGGPTPIFAQGSVPSQLTGIGGSPSAPAFTQQSYYGQPSAPASQPSVSAGYANPSGQYQLPQSAGGSSQGTYGQLAPTVYPASQFSQTTPGSSYNPGVAPISASQYFQGNLQLQGPGAVTSQSFAGASQINPNAAGGQAGQFLPQLQSTQQAYAPYSGGQLPIFTQGSVPSQLTGIGGGNSQTPVFAGQNNYVQPSSPASQPSVSMGYSNPSTGYQMPGGSAGQFTPTLTPLGQPVSVGGAQPITTSYTNPTQQYRLPESLGGSSGTFLPPLSQQSNAPLPPTRPTSFGSASAGQFTSNVGFGSRSTTVSALQQQLIDQGYLRLRNGPTGYYGPLTERAIIRYQRANGIQQTGFVGPVTRCYLNGGVYHSSTASCVH